MQNLIQKYHDETGKTYFHMARTVNLILRKDLNSNYSITKQTLNNYANGATTPMVPDIIKAIAKMLKVDTATLTANLEQNHKGKEK